MEILQKKTGPGGLDSGLCTGGVGSGHEGKRIAALWRDHDHGRDLESRLVPVPRPVHAPGLGRKSLHLGLCLSHGHELNHLPGLALGCEWWCVVMSPCVFERAP